MNTYLLGAGLLVLLLGLGGWLWSRRRARAPAREAAAGARPAAPAVRQALAAPSKVQADATPATGPSAETQRQAATEALRQARQRKAEQAVRREAQHQAESLREAQQQAQTAAAAQQAQAQARLQAPAQAQTRPPQARPPAPPLPAIAQVAARPRPPEPPVRPPAAPVQPAPRAPGPATVLLADDSKVVRIKTGRLLEKQGWRVLLAEDGLAALQMLEHEAPDLLITDVEMPGLDGFELTRRLRAQTRWRRLPVIMITSSDDKHRDEARAAGVDLLMGKPYAEETLLAQVQQLLGVTAGLAMH